MPSRAVRYGIVASRFNREITEALLRGALNFFKDRRVPLKAVDVVWVAGAFELSVAALKMARSRRYVGIVAVGCILAGETPHFDFLSQAALQGLTMAGLLSGVPVTCGVITARRWGDARARASPNGLNRGRQAAEAVWDLAHTLKRF